MHAYEVGKPYIAGRRQWPEGADYNWRDGEHELRLFYRRPTLDETQDIRHGRPQFAFLERGDVILFLWKLGAQEWSDKPYSYHLVPAEQQVLPSPDDEGGMKRQLLHVVLVDADTGLIKALRVVSFSPEFTTAIHAAIRAQAARPWPGDDAYSRQAAALYAEFPTSAAMSRAAKAEMGGEQP